MAGVLRGYITELVDAFTAAGLEARSLFDPDRGGPGVVIGIPTFAYDRPPRVGCQDLTVAPVSCEIVVVGAGWAPEQRQKFVDDVETCFYAVPVPWRPASSQDMSSPDAPLIQITALRN